MSDRTIGAPAAIGGRKKVYKIVQANFEVDEKYDVLSVLGSGAYGVVAAALDTSTGQSVAIKKLGMIFDDLVDGKRMLREILLLRYFDHKNILGLQTILMPREGPMRFQDLYLVTELFETDLHKVLTSRQSLTEEHFQVILHQTILALKHMHTAKVIHRDLKPANILMNSNLDVKLCDFGLSRGGVFSTSEMLDLTEYVVSRRYRAPEILLASRYNHLSDMWSIGVIAAEMALRKPLFSGKGYLEQIEVISDHLGSPQGDITWISNRDALRYVAEMPIMEPKSWKVQLRGSSRTLVDFISKLVVWDPRKRFSVDEALQHPYIAHLYNPEEDTLTIRKEPDWSTIDRAEGLREKELRDLLWREVESMN